MNDRSIRRRLTLALERRNQASKTEHAQGYSKEEIYKELAPLIAEQMRSAFKANQESAQQAENAEHRTNERSLTASTRTVARFTVALVFVGILSAVVSFLQWREMNSSGGQTEQLIAANAKVAAASEKTAETAAKNLIATQRAWLGVIDVNVTITGPNSSVKAKVAWSNSGREPAHNWSTAGLYVFTRNEWEHGGVAFEAINKRQSKCIKNNSIIGDRYAWPTTGFNNYFMGAPNDYLRIPDNGYAIWTPELIKGDSILTIEGCMIYEAFGEIKHTNFCYDYDAKISDPAHLNICTAGNYAN